MSLVKNFIQFSWGTWVSAVISFFTTPIVTLLILPEDFGKVAMFTLANSIVLQLVLAGGDQSFMRFFYERGENRRSALLWNSLLPSVFIWIFISFLFLGFREQISTWLIAEYQPLIVALLSTDRNSVV